MGLLTFSINVTLDGCVDHQEGIADDETHAYFTNLMDSNDAMLWGRTTYEMMESYWPLVARGEVEAPSAMREWALALEAKPKYVVSTTRSDFPWTGSHHLTGDLRTAVRGCLRRVAVNLYRVHSEASAQLLDSVSLAQWGKRGWFTGEAPARRGF